MKGDRVWEIVYNRYRDNEGAGGQASDSISDDHDGNPPP